MTATAPRSFGAQLKGSKTQQGIFGPVPRLAIV